MPQDVKSKKQNVGLYMINNNRHQLPRLSTMLFMPVEKWISVVYYVIELMMKNTLYSMTSKGLDKVIIFYAKQYKNIDSISSQHIIIIAVWPLLFMGKYLYMLFLFLWFVYCVLDECYG